MLFTSTNNKLVLTIYDILWEVFIGFGAFIIFFGIFIKYYFNDYEDNLMKGYIKNSTTFYKPLVNTLNYGNIIKNNSEQAVDVKKLNDEANAREIEVRQNNIQYDDLLMKIIIWILIIFIAVLVLPLLLGIIAFDYVNWKYIGTSFTIHLIFVAIFEYILLYIIIPINNPIEIFRLFDGVLTTIKS